ncbi:hypothetical protein CGLAMM_11480 [Acetobacteraceae bacterium EV16G]
MRVQLVELDLIRNKAVLPEMAGLEGWNGRPWGRSPLIRKRWKAMRPCDIPMRVTCRMIIRPTHLTLFKV